VAARGGRGGRDGGHVGRQEADDDGSEASAVAVARGRRRRRVGGTETVTGRRHVDEHRHQHRQTCEYTHTIIVHSVDMQTRRCLRSTSSKCVGSQKLTVGRSNVRLKSQLGV